MNHRSPYLEWIKQLQFPKYNLGMSGLYFDGTVGDLGIEISDYTINSFGAYGYPGLYEALNHRYKVPQESIIVGIGVSGVNYMLFKALFAPEDEVLVETPVYDPLPNAIQAVGARPVFIPRDISQGFQIEENILRKLISSKTKGMVITNLHNPSGVYMPPEKIKSLAHTLSSLGAYLIIDEIYLEFFFGHKLRTAFGLMDNIITTSSLTKAFGIGGLRAGWAFAPPKIIDKIKKVYNLLIGSGPAITEKIVSRIIADDKIVKKFELKAKSLIEENLPLVEEFIASRNGLRWVKPDGGISCFPMISSSEMVAKLYDTLLNEYQTLIIPGKFFSAPMGFRLSYGIPQDILIQGLKNLGNALDAINFHLTNNG